MKFFILANLMLNLIPNFIKKIEFKSNFKVVELEFELEPCDIAVHRNILVHTLVHYCLYIPLYTYHSYIIIIISYHVASYHHLHVPYQGIHHHMNDHNFIHVLYIYTLFTLSSIVYLTLYTLLYKHLYTMHTYIIKSE